MKGIYALIIAVRRNMIVDAGALRRIRLKRGLYVYVGSAQTGMEKRIARHLRRTKRRFWHIDYLLDAGVVSVLKVFQKQGPKSEECRTARLLGRVGTGVKGFGSSDCHCPSHLFKVQSYVFLRDWMDELALG